MRLFRFNARYYSANGMWLLRSPCLPLDVKYVEDDASIVGVDRKNRQRDLFVKGYPFLTSRRTIDDLFRTRNPSAQTEYFVKWHFLGKRRREFR